MELSRDNDASPVFFLLCSYNKYQVNLVMQMTKLVQMIENLELNHETTCMVVSCGMSRLKNENLKMVTLVNKNVSQSEFVGKSFCFQEKKKSVFTIVLSTLVKQKNMMFLAQMFPRDVFYFILGLRK